MLCLVDMLLTGVYVHVACKPERKQQRDEELAAGAEPDSAAEGVDTAVGQATEIARTGSSTKTQSKSQDPKVHVIETKALPSAPCMHANACV